MPFAEVNDQRIHYEVEGEGEPLICIAGLGADALSWSFQVPEWSKHFRTVVFDNRDAGQSSAAEGDYEIADMAEDALGLADHLELERFHVLGASMGGAIAQELALGWPDRVATLTLCVTWAGSGEWGREFSRLWAGQVERTPFEEHVDNLLRLTLSEQYFESSDEVDALRRMALDNPYPQSNEAFRRQLGCMGRHEARGRLPALSLPVHVIGAEQDILVPVWKSREIAALVPGATLTVIEGAAHGLNFERADELSARVLDFLQAHAAAAPAPV